MIIYKIPFKFSTYFLGHSKDKGIGGQKCFAKVFIKEEVRKCALLMTTNIKPGLSRFHWSLSAAKITSKS